MSTSELYVPLGQGAGYGVVLGLGLFFAAGMMLITYVLKRYNREVMTAEEFSTAGRSVKKFLISACVVSSWTWSATLLTSTTQTYKNGISGAFYYASGATCQIILFSCLAIKAKERAPGAHTYLEIVKARYGKTTHLVYCTWGIITNILVTAMLLAGGSGVVSDLTGMDVSAACLLIPLGVVIYTLFGGLKATFITDYVHGAAVVILAMIFGFVVWSTDSELGSPGKVWELVTQVGIDKPREGNADGSYLTMHSRSGGIFFVVNIVGNFGTVFLDNGYFNKAFAANPAAAMPGYVMGGLAWFAIPFFLATTMGMAALALENSPAWPTYPRSLSTYEINAGLVLPNAAVALLGKGGAVAALFLSFTAVTSAMSSELIAVSSIVTFDFYRTYFNPNASGKRLMMVSHISVSIFAYVMAGFAIGLYYAGVSMGYLYELMGVIIGGAVLPSALTLLSTKQNAAAAIWTPPIATGLAIMAWLATTKGLFGSITVDTTFEDDAMLTGNVVALLTPAITIPILTWAFKPQNFDWDVLKSITRVSEEEELIEAETGMVPVSQDLEKDAGSVSKMEPITSQVSRVASEIAMVNKDKYAEESAMLAKSFKIVVALCAFLTISMVVIWPMPMYGSSYIFSKKFFTGWIVVGFMWIFFTAGVTIIGPVYESRGSIANTFRCIFWDLTGRGYKVKEWQNANMEKLHSVRSQVRAHLDSQLSTEVVEARNIDEYISNDESEEKK
ncbi:urea active transporter [Yamadazyma tenuis]|uniref:Urea active transport protein n=1 Tax=Candida tenuis (strain ATCC 10573 / BCRC 21748 / CBS 615 / JCM 9827 / NBRC 10315 / NRRL Y-1498 / VKM Y-70) TaxID=590646 RepID=G3B9J7_CANTC|nr:urea active transport protein [Yamadazyma tenuis ATCC 10573]EGV61906.1 urea active transport protein [Yamadazyma tenuis ATCC 10573]WEJ93140.1 urea active transporter [Yamadazyma tenuis]